MTMLIVSGTPRAAGRGMDVLGEVVDDRQVEQRLAAEEHHGQAFRADRVELTFGVRDHLRRGLERHLVGVAVVIVVIALEAVAAGEVALQRGQDGEAKLRRVVPDRVEVGIEGAAIGVVALDDEAELGERGERLAFLVVERAGTGVPPGCVRPSTESSSETTSGGTMIWASVSVFIRNTSDWSRSGTRTLKMDGCMAGVTELQRPFRTPPAAWHSCECHALEALGR